MMIRLKFVSIESVFYMVVRKYNSPEPLFIIKDDQIARPLMCIFLRNAKKVFIGALIHGLICIQLIQKYDGFEKAENTYF